MNLIEITDVNAPELAVFTQCSEPQLFRYYEPEIGIFVAESASVILRALEDGYEPLAVLVETGRMEAEAAPVFDAIETYWGAERRETIPVYTADKEIVAQLTGYTLVRGLWMTMRRRPEMPLEEFLRDKRRIAVLYEVVNPANAGAIIRSAAALGMDGVLLSYGSVDPLARRASRVSMGTVFQIPWTKATRSETEGLALLDTLRAHGFKTVAMALTEDSTNIDNDDIAANERLAVLLGSEGPGLPKDVIAACDYRVMIPMHYGVDSLNVAAASAIAFWELMK